MTGRLRLVVLCLVSAAVLLVIGTADPGGAIIRRRTITPEVDTGLPVRTDGHHVSMTGPMACDPGESWEVTADLTQSGARGGGRGEGVCRGDVQEWVVRVVGEGDARFRPGPARGCAVLRTLKDRAETDRHQWCNDIRLIAAGAPGEDDGENGEGALSWVALAVGVVAVVVAVVALIRPRRTT
jgi:hypothetical protein